MSDLQMVLIAIGILIILAVVVINWWQERKFHQQVERNFSQLNDDALLQKSAPGLVGDDELADEAELNGNLQTHFAKAGFDSKHDASVKERFADTYDEFMDKSPKLAQEFKPENFAVNNADGRIEPVFDDALEAVAKPKEILKEKLLDTENVAQHNEIKAIFEEAFKQPEATSSKPDEVEAELEPASLTLPATLHSQIDLIAVLYLATEMPLSALKKELSSLLVGYDKPTFVHVLASGNQAWQVITEANEDVKVSRIACSIQMADRGGAVSRNTLNRFQLALESAGLELNAHVEWQNATDALNLATALDAFCIEVDKTVGFHLVHGENGAFTGTKLRGLAEAQGLTLTSDGVFKYMDEKFNQASFVMFNQDNNPFSPEMLRTSVVKGVTFQLDIPHVMHCTEAFTQMVQVARQMEIGLNAVLVDDNSKILGDIQIEKIRQQLKVIHAKMLVRGITPGTDSAHRLFT